MADIFFGEVDGVNEGDWFEDRAALRKAGIHRPLVAGIDGNKIEGASSIVLNGGYIDDQDLGDEIIYTGHGGNNPDSGRQIADQSWDHAGNKGLVISEIKGLPVRVTRGAKHKSSFSPKKGYQYSGLYQVTHHFQEAGKDGYQICRYRLQKINLSEATTSTNSTQLPQGITDVKRSPLTVLRLVRDTVLSRTIKELYNYTCQVCGIRIEVRGVPYAEAAHIKPLGKPHNGHDTPENLLCLCPNHHVMFDKGAFSINKQMGLVGLAGTLTIHDAHTIDEDNMSYHFEHIFINDIH